jgi:hypothetical protein
MPCQQVHLRRRLDRREMHGCSLHSCKLSSARGKVEIGNRPPQNPSRTRPERRAAQAFLGAHHEDLGRRSTLDLDELLQGV